MAIDSTIAIRRGMLAIAKADAALVAIVPAARIYPQTTPALPAFPFIRAGALSVIPVRGACLDGGNWIFAMHAFAKDRQVSGQIVETAEDYAGRIGAALAAALDRHVIELSAGRATIRWDGSQLLMDPDEGGCFHAVVNFRVRAITG